MGNEIDTGTADRSGTSLQVIPGGKEPDKLTGKQLAFVQAILKGENQSNAYRLAYSAENMSPQAIWTEAGRLFRHPAVSRRITSGRAAQERQALHTGASLRSHIERELFELSTNAESDQSRLRALELLGKLEKVGAFTERVEQVNDNLSAEEIEAELQALLEAFEPEPV
jgi:phage terminase small subunit